MTKVQSNGKIIRHPFAVQMQHARVDAYREEKSADGLNVTLDLLAFELQNSRLRERGGRLVEQVSGYYFPMQLRFARVEAVRQNGFFSNLENVKLDDPSRIIRDMLCWVQPGKPEPFYLFYMNTPVSGSLRFYAAGVKSSSSRERQTPMEAERDWSPAPPMPTGEVPAPEELYKQFAGDPIPVQIDGHLQRRRLFVGGVETQGRQRPEVDAVLNLGEEPSMWAKGGQVDPADRWVNKGEGKDGMSVDEIRGEAGWVIERLQAGKKVLVHCVAGMNRSAAVTCAVLMLMEGLSAEAALARVRKSHPWSRPDPNHWLKLRWLAQQLQK